MKIASQPRNQIQNSVRNPDAFPETRVMAAGWNFDQAAHNKQTVIEMVYNPSADHAFIELYKTPKGWHF